MKIEPRHVVEVFEAHVVGADDGVLHCMIGNTGSVAKTCAMVSGLAVVAVMEGVSAEVGDAQAAASPVSDPVCRAADVLDLVVEGGQGLGPAGHTPLMDARGLDPRPYGRARS